MWETAGRLDKKKRDFEGEWSNFLCFDQSSRVEERVTFKETFQGLFLPFSVFSFLLFFQSLPSLVFGLHSREIKHCVYVLNVVIVKKKKSWGGDFHSAENVTGTLHSVNRISSDAECVFDEKVTKQRGPGKMEPQQKAGSYALRTQV